MTFAGGAPPVRDGRRCEHLSHYAGSRVGGTSLRFPECQICARSPVSWEVLMASQYDG
jgi:hypothetical protein